MGGGGNVIKILTIAVGGRRWERGTDHDDQTNGKGRKENESSGFCFFFHFFLGMNCVGVDEQLTVQSTDRVGETNKYNMLHTDLFMTDLIRYEITRYEIRCMTNKSFHAKHLIQYVVVDGGLHGS